MSQGLLRVLTAVVGIPIFVGGVYLGGYWFGGIIALVALVSAIEMADLLKAGGSEPLVAPGLVLGAILLLRFWVPLWEPAVILLAAAIILATPGLRGDRPVDRLAATGMMVIYPAWLLSFVTAIREGVGLEIDGQEAMWLTIMFLVMIWSSDTFAYYTGRMVGRTPFFPAISPKKTWEGFVGGAVGTALAGALIKQVALPFLNWTDAVILILICGVLGPVGDLAESRMKRSVEAKDSGSLLPGHGGLLDRFDSMIVCAPLVWLFLAYLSSLQ